MAATAVHDASLDFAEEAYTKLPRSLSTHFKMRPSNNLVKVRLVKLSPKTDIPASTMVYNTDDTDTEINPRPRDMSGYVFTTFESELTSAIRSSSPPPRPQAEAPAAPVLKPFYRGSLFQRRANNVLMIEGQELSQSVERLLNERNDSASSSRGRLRASLDKPLEDSRLSVAPKLSNFNTPNNSAINDSLRNNVSKQTKHVDSMEGRTNDTNLVNTSKLLSETMGNNRSILKTSQLRSQGGPRDPSPRKVRFSKLRTVVYFNLLHNETAQKRKGG